MGWNFPTRTNPNQVVGQFSNPEPTRNHQTRNQPGTNPEPGWNQHGNTLKTTWKHPETNPIQVTGQFSNRNQPIATSNKHMKTKISKPG